MADRSQQAQKVFDALEKKVEQMGLELVDVVFVKEGSSRFLRLFIDKKGGVSIDDCSDVSRMADPVIDEELKISSHDYLEVSSPGLERPLKTLKDYERYQGELVELKLYKSVDGEKTYQGYLEPCTEDHISISMEDGVIKTFNRSDISRVKRIILFE